MTVGTGQTFGESALPLRILLIAIHEVDGEHPRSQPERRLHRVGEALLHRRLGGESIDDDVDRVLALFVQSRWIHQLPQLAVHAHPGEALGGQLPKEVDVFALASAYDRGEDLESGPLGEFQQPVGDLLGTLLADRFATLHAVRMTRPSEQQPQIVIDLGDGAHGGARVTAGRLLIDGHRRGQTFDEVHIRFVHLAQELSGIGRQALHVAPLPLGKDGVEGETRLARPGQAGEHNQGIPREIQVEISQIVLAGTPNDQAV